MSNDTNRMAALVKELVERLESPGIWYLRRDAAEALHKGAQASLYGLRKVSDDEDTDVRNFAQGAVEDIRKNLDVSPDALRPDVETFLSSGAGYEAPADEAAPTPKDEKMAATVAMATQPTLGDREAIEAAVKQRAAEIQAEVRPTSKGLVVKIDTSGAEDAEPRGQSVYVEFGRKDHRDRLLVLVYTLCGPADPDKYEQALKTNARLSEGQLAVTRVGEEKMLILVETLVQNQITADGVFNTIAYLARAGDRVEEAFTREDKY